MLYTGDLFRTDEDGFLYFVGRKDDIIKTRGEKVSPKEVENVLYALAGVQEAAVVGVPDPVLGLAIKAVVALDSGTALTAADVIRHCARNLEDFMVPKIVEFRDRLPEERERKDRPASGRGGVPGGGAMNRHVSTTQTTRLSHRMRCSSTPRAKPSGSRLRSAISVLKTLRKRGAIVGLSGGIDSSVTAALCVARARGEERARGVHAGEGFRIRTACGSAGRLPMTSVSRPWSRTSRRN